jgi:hypothetical protein
VDTKTMADRKNKLGLSVVPKWALLRALSAESACSRAAKLGFEPPDTLTVEPARLCPPEFAEVLRAHKPALLALLKLPFVMVQSATLGETTILFCADEDTKGALVEAGAELWSIYTLAELQTLCGQNRVAPLTAAETAESPWDQTHVLWQDHHIINNHLRSGGARHLIFELVIVSDSASGIILRSAEVAAFAFHRACSSTYTTFGSTLTISGQHDAPRWLQFDPDHDLENY